MIGSKSHQNRPMYRGKARDGHIPSKSMQRKKKTKADSSKYDNNVVPFVVPVHDDVPDDEGSQLIVIQDRTNHGLIVKQKDLIETQHETDENCISDYEQKVLEEIKHVQKRITNIQEAIQLSPTMASPEVWKENCLNAILNCVNEWRNIVSYHGCYYSHGIGVMDQNGNQNEIHNVLIDDLANSNSQVTITNPNLLMHPMNELSKETSRRVFGLIQMALQTGPLKASNPGYFKRSGAEVAKFAKDFLEGCIGNDAQEQLRFTTKQDETLKKWLRDAIKVVNANKPPSKSAAKAQAVGEKYRKR